MRFVKASDAKRMPSSRLSAEPCEVASIAQLRSPASSISRNERWRSIASGVVRTAGRRSPPTRRLDRAEQPRLAAGGLEDRVEQEGGRRLAVRPRDARDRRARPSGRRRTRAPPGPSLLSRRRRRAAARVRRPDARRRAPRRPPRSRAPRGRARRSGPRARRRRARPGATARRVVGEIGDLDLTRPRRPGSGRGSLRCASSSTGAPRERYQCAPLLLRRAASLARPAESRGIAGRSPRSAGTPVPPRRRPRSPLRARRP